MSDYKKLLEGLTGNGISVTVSDLAKYMSSNGVCVSPTIGRRRGYVSLNEKAYGINLDDMTETGSNFFRSRVSQGHLNFIPPEDEAAFGALEKRLRRAVERKTLSDGFMPVTAYEDLKAEFEKIRAEYFAKRDEVLAKWDFLVADFKAGAKEMLEGIHMPDYQREQVLQSFVKEIPSEADYRDSFTVSLSVRAFPATCTQEGLNSSVAAAVKDTWQDDVMTTAITAIESLIGQMWAKCNAAIKQYIKSGGIKTNTLRSLANLVAELKWKNVFCNPMLTQLQTQLSGVAQGDDESAADIIEEAISTIYAYADEAHLDLDFTNSPYTAQQLKQMSAIQMAQRKRSA